MISSTFVNLDVGYRIVLVIVHFGYLFTLLLEYTLFRYYFLFYFLMMVITMIIYMER